MKPYTTSLGSDISTQYGLNPTFSLLSDNKVIGEALLRRLTTPRGSLSFQPDYGIDVRMWLCESIDTATLAAMVQEIETECQKDERVNSANAAVQFDYSTQILKIKLAIVTAVGPFQFTIDVTKLSAQLLSN